MTVLALERTPKSLRGHLTRWLLEPQAGVFVGTVSAEVRDRLWEMVCRGRRSGAGVLISSADTEQGFAIRICGDRERVVADFDGLMLIRQAR